MNFNWLFNNFLNLFSSCNLTDFCNYFLNISVHFDNFFNLNIVHYDIISNTFNFSNFSLNVWHDFFDLFNDLLNNYLNLLFRDFLQSNFLYFNFDYLFNFSNALDNLFDILFNYNNSINILWNWDRTLDRNWVGFFSFEEFTNFVDDWNDLINFNFFRNLDFLFDNFFIDLFDYFTSFNYFFDFNNFLNNLFNNFRLSYVGINWNLNLFDSILVERNLYNFLYLNNFGVFYYSVHDSLNNLRHFDNLFNNSRNDNNFLDDLFNFNNSRDLHHFLDNFVNIDSHLFNSFNSFWHLNNLFNHYFNWVIDININNDWFLNFNDFGNLDNFVNIFNNLNYPWYLYFFNNYLSNNFWYSDNSLLDHRNLNSAVNNFFDLSNNFNGVINYSLNLFKSVLIDNFLFNNFNFFDFNNFYFNFNNLFNYSWYLDNSFNSLEKGYRPFNNNFNNFRNFLNMINNLSSVLDFDLFD